MKIIFVAFPEPTENPYIKLLSDALKGADPNLEVLIYSPEPVKNLLKNGDKFILHIHWPHIAYPASKNPFKSAWNALKFLTDLRKLKIRGIKIIWTVHDYASHDYPYPWLDKLVYQTLFSLVDNFIVHTEAGKDFLTSKKITENKISIIPHGNYINICGPKVDSAEARKKLGLTKEDAVFLNLGLLRPYKNLNFLISAFFKLTDKKIKLILAGKSLGIKIDINKIRSATDKIIVYDKYVSLDEIPTFLGAADFFILANKNMLSSGAIILALSYGVPIIAPQSGDAPYLIKNGVSGFLYEPGNEDALLEVIKKATSLPEEKRREMRKLAIESVKSYTWDQIANDTLKIYIGQKM